MMLINGFPLVFDIPLPFGAPDGDISWEVKDSGSAVLESSTVTPGAGAVSVEVTVGVVGSTLGVGSNVDYRTFEWTYEVGGAPVSVSKQVRIENLPPFGANRDGVRSKLAVSEVDLPDDEIFLMNAYVSLRNETGAAEFDAVTRSEYNDKVLKDGIEAIAALSHIATMQVRVARQEASESNSFQRQNVDWAKVKDELEDLVGRAYDLVQPNVSADDDFTPLLVIATPAVDNFTG